MVYSEWQRFVDEFYEREGRWPTSSEVELGLGLPVQPVRITGR